MEKSNVKKRNSLIELLRFLFAMNVVIGHGFFPVQLDIFGLDRISVEFFFILSGYLFTRSLPKLAEMKTVEAIKTTLISKLKPLLIPMVIGMVSNLFFNILTDHSRKYDVFRFLWYIPAMLAIMVVYAILITLLKKENVFWWVVAGLCFIATVLRFSGNEDLFYFDYIRSTAAVSMGMLMGKLPKPQYKHKITGWLLLAPVVVATFSIVYYRLARTDLRYEAILDMVLYPLLVYLSFGVDFHFAPFNYLGAISFGIYAFQCTARLVECLGVTDEWAIFGVIVIPAVIYDLVRRIVRFIKQKSKNKSPAEPSPSA